jgi:hypothetical protein
MKTYLFTFCFYLLIFTVDLASADSEMIMAGSSGEVVDSNKILLKGINQNIFHLRYSDSIIHKCSVEQNKYYSVYQTSLDPSYNSDYISENNSIIRFAAGLLIIDTEVQAGIIFQGFDELYSLQLPIITTLVFNDINNGNKTSLSFTGLISFGMLCLGAMAHTDDIGSAADNLKTFLILPILLASSQHHLYIIPPHTSEDENRFALSLYGDLHGDFFERWWRYITAAGINLEFNYGTGKNAFQSKGVSIQFGVESAIIGEGIYNKNISWFGGGRFRF